MVGYGIRDESHPYYPGKNLKEEKGRRSGT